MGKWINKIINIKYFFKIYIISIICKIILLLIFVYINFLLYGQFQAFKVMMCFIKKCNDLKL